MRGGYNFDIDRFRHELKFKLDGNDGVYRSGTRRRLLKDPNFFRSQRRRRSKVGQETYMQMLEKEGVSSLPTRLSLSSPFR